MIIRAFIIIGLFAGCASAPGVNARSMTNPLERGPGAIEIVPAVHFPQPEIGSVKVWLTLPEGSKLEVHQDENGRRSFNYPPGTWADRVEIAGEGAEERVVDIRGTSFDDEGRPWHHVYRPTRRNPKAPLVGAQWLADEPQHQARGAELLLKQLADGGVTGNLEHVSAKLDCDGCHIEGRADNVRAGDHGLVARGTDPAGFFTPSTLLANDIPLERYGVVDPNVHDPHVVVRCGDQAPVTTNPYRCADGTVPRGTLSLEAALAAGDAHALAHCATWSALVPFLPDDLQPPAACGRKS